MTSYIINADILQKLFLVNQFEIPAECKLIFVGIRGSLPADVQDTSFKNAQTIILKDVDYRNLRCCFLQWNTDTNEVAIRALGLQSFTGCRKPADRMCKLLHRLAGPETLPLRPGLFLLPVQRTKRYFPDTRNDGRKNKQCVYRIAV